MNGRGMESKDEGLTWSEPRWTVNADDPDGCGVSHTPVRY